MASDALEPLQSVEVEEDGRLCVDAAIEVTVQVPG